ncbi:carbohydrate ABC transporter permease [Isoptericola sp. F-RaC21]|uniref:carbohydrate ABC transporter permease n=1 Tax=Isoptericola sp. F-RaC21 TaxID=3141452 RepID=UPI00315B7104
MAAVSAPAAPAATGAPPSSAPRPAQRRARRRRGAVRLLGYVVLVAAAAAIMLPFAWMVISSLKENNDVFTVPLEWIPDPVRWSNYVDIWAKSDMVTWVKNTLVLSVTVTALQVTTGSFAAYGFAKMRFPGRNVLFLVYVGTIAVPWQSYMIPQFVMLSDVGLSNTLWAIVALQTFSAFGVFLMKQYYESIPESLSEAARIDGMSEYGIWWRIMLPLSKPAIASLVLLTFVNTWNDYLGPLIYLRDPQLWTIQLGLKTFISQYNAEYALIMAGSVLSVLPVALIFLFGQRYFVQGIATSGVKG